MRTHFSTYAVLLTAVATMTGCTSVSSNYHSVKKETTSSKLSVCHGFDCRNRTALQLTSDDDARFASIMAGGSASAKAERAAVASAVSYFETRAGQTIGVADTA